MIKFIKKTIAVILLISTVFSLTACADSNSESSSSEIKENENTPRTISESFINSLIKKDYETALSCLNLDKSKSFVTSEDIEFYLPRSSFADIMDWTSDGNIIIKTESVSESEVLCTASFNNDTSSVSIIKPVYIKTVLNNNNNWTVDASEFYNKNYKFYTAGGDVKVSVNGKEVSNDFCTNTSAGNNTGLAYEYTLPYVGEKDIKVELSCDSYTYESVLATSSDNTVSENDMVFKPANVDEINSCIINIKHIWNSLCDNYKSSKRSSCVMDYLASDADSDICNQIWDGFELLHKSNSGVSSDRDDNFKLTMCKIPNNNGVYWLTDNKMMVNFDYELTWDYILADAHETMRRKSNIVLEKENGEYKIYKLIDSGLFTENNNFINEW